MGRLFERIRDAVNDGRYVVGDHAAIRADERGIADWQLVAGLKDGILRRERRRAQPNPCVEVEQLLADGTSVIVVWSWLAHLRVSKLVTVYFLDG